MWISCIRFGASRSIQTNSCTTYSSENRMTQVASLSNPFYDVFLSLIWISTNYRWASNPKTFLQLVLICHCVFWMIRGIQINYGFKEEEDPRFTWVGVCACSLPLSLSLCTAPNQLEAIPSGFKDSLSSLSACIITKQYAQTATEMISLDSFDCQAYIPSTDERWIGSQSVLGCLTSWGCYIIFDHQCVHACVRM